MGRDRWTLGKARSSLLIASGCLATRASTSCRRKLMPSTFLSGRSAWVCLFFFSSRRRHTRCYRDWSSDVCSSDLSVGDAVYLRLASHFFRPTLVPNTVETERRRDELRRSVDPSKYIVRAGDRIVSAHEVVTNEVHEKLVALHNDLVRRGAATSHSLGGALGPMLRDSLILAIFWVLMVFYRRETYAELRQVALIVGLFALVLLQAAAVARFVPEHAEIVILPFLAMMLTVLFNGRVSMIAAMILAAVIGLQPVFHEMPALFFCMVGGVTAALSVRALRRRSNFYVPVLLIALGYLAGALALGLAGSWSVGAIGLRGVWGAANGLVCAGLTFFLLPVAEAITRITTDLTLP